jgi:hypothetical protein
MERSARPERPPPPPALAGRTDVRKTLRPGEAGTRKLVRKYGDDLVCVRYRHDDTAGVRLTTVEIVVERAKLRRPRALPPSALVYAMVEPWETPLHEKLKKSGARWDPALRLWRMRYDAALALGLRRRILKSLPKPGNGHR